MNDDLTAPSPRGLQPLTQFQLERLHADLHPSRVASRTGGGGAQLSYLEAYDVRATLIRIFGYGNFSVEVTDTRLVHESQYANSAGKEQWRIGVICTVRLTIHQTGAVYSESAAASQSNPDYGEALDFAVKTAESDALKRCATNLGSTFGLSLYNAGSTADIVRVVYSPDQKDVIDDLRALRAGGEDAPAALARMQARLKTLAAPEKDADTAGEVDPADQVIEPGSPAPKKGARPKVTRQPSAARSTRRPAAVPDPVEETTAGDEPAPALAVVS